MRTSEFRHALTATFSELVEGAAPGGGAFILNSGDAGLLRSLDRLSADEASRSVEGGATIAAHARHVGYGLGLMNRWVREGRDAFADANWDAAWKTTSVAADEWDGIREHLRREARVWLESLGGDREVSPQDVTGLVASIAHVAYHLGAIRQIARNARGPKEGTYP